MCKYLSFISAILLVCLVNIYGLGYFFEITGTYSNGNPAVICAEIPSDAMGKSVFVAIAGVMGDQSKPHIINSGRDITDLDHQSVSDRHFAAGGLCEPDK